MQEFVALGSKRVSRKKRPPPWPACCENHHVKRALALCGDRRAVSSVASLSIPVDPAGKSDATRPLRGRRSAGKEGRGTTSALKEARSGAAWSAEIPGRFADLPEFLRGQAPSELASPRGRRTLRAELAHHLDTSEAAEELAAVDWLLSGRCLAHLAVVCDVVRRSKGEDRWELLRQAAAWRGSSVPTREITCSGRS